MRKSLNKILPILIFMIMCLSILSPTVRAAENPTLELNAAMKVSGAIPDSPGDFLIKFSRDEIVNPMPVGSIDGISTTLVKGASLFTLPKITFSSVGTYSYTIYQQPGSDQNYTYDPTVYRLTVFVSGSNNNLNISAVVYKKDGSEKSSDIIFTNNYVKPAKMILRVLKSLDGAIPPNGQFNFQMLNELREIKQTKSNLGENVVFDEVEFNKVGTYIFFIREKVGTDPKIIYDNAEFKVTVVVTKNPMGNFEAAWSYTKNGNPFTEILSFANKSIPGKLPETGGESGTGQLPNTGGVKPGTGQLPSTGAGKPKPQELPKTGEAKSTLPVYGLIMILGGLTLTMKRKIKI